MELPIKTDYNKISVDLKMKNEIKRKIYEIKEKEDQGS